MKNADDDWKDAILNRILSMEKAQAELSRHAFGSGNYERAADKYVAACLDLLNHIDEVYGSPEDFSEFLRAETRHLVRAQGFSMAEIENMDWHVDGGDDVAQAENAARLYTGNYRTMIDSLAYLRQFRHKEPERSST